MSMETFFFEEMGLYVKISELNLTTINNDFFGDLELSDDEIIENIKMENLCCTDGGEIIAPYSFGTDAQGTASYLLDKCFVSSLDFNGDDWVLMKIPRYPSLFVAQYKDEDSLIDEMQSLYSKYIKTDLDYKSRLIIYAGTIIGDLWA